MTELTSKPVEQATAYVLPPTGDNSVLPPQPQLVAVVPTQVRRPWQATIRTAFQALVALATLVPLVLTDVYDSPDSYPAVITQVVVVAGLVSRVMANPAVEQFLRSFLPFLAAAPPVKPTNEGGSVVLEAIGAVLIVVGLVILFAYGAVLVGLVLAALGVAVVLVGANRRGGVL